MLYTFKHCDSDLPESPLVWVCRCLLRTWRDLCHQLSPISNSDNLHPQFRITMKNTLEMEDKSFHVLIWNCSHNNHPGPSSFQSSSLFLEERQSLLISVLITETLANPFTNIPQLTSIQSLTKSWKKRSSTSDYRIFSTLTKLWVFSLQFHA